VVVGVDVRFGVVLVLVLEPRPLPAAAATMEIVRIAAVAAIFPNDGHRVPLHTHKMAMIGEMNTHATTCTQPCCPRNRRQSDWPLSGGAAAGGGPAGGGVA
jgi:hypothetical protein